VYQELSQAARQQLDGFFPPPRLYGKMRLAHGFTHIQLCWFATVLPAVSKTLQAFFHQRTKMKQFARRMRPIPTNLFHHSNWLFSGAAARLALLGVTAATAIGLSACASSNTASLIHLPDGQTGYAINCSGADESSTWGSCYVLAGNKCGATGYTIVSKDNEEGGPTGGGITNVISANVKNRSMVVRCN